MGKRQDAALETKRKIISAAEKLINEKGFDNIGVLDITNEAGVAKGSFYTYFKHKEDVVCEIAYSRFSAMEEQSKSADDICGQIISFLTGSMKYITDTGLNICQQWLKNSAEPEDRYGKDKLAYDTGVIRDAIKSAADRNELQPDTPAEELAEIITAEYYGAVTLWAITNGNTDPSELLENYCRHTLRPMLARFKI